jgi:hypothetical protein
MKAYFVGKQPPEVLEQFERHRPPELLKESMDIVEFVLTLEESLGREIGFAQIGPALASKTFGELSVEVARLLNES